MTTLALNELSRSMRERLGLDPAAERVMPGSRGDASAGDPQARSLARTPPEDRAEGGNRLRIGTLSTGMG